MERLKKTIAVKCAKRGNDVTMTQDIHKKSKGIPDGQMIKHKTLIDRVSFRRLIICCCLDTSPEIL